MYISLVVMTMKLPFIGICLAVDYMRSLGKIYVVVAVLVCIFIGLAITLFYMDRRLKQLEKNSLNEQSKENA